MYKIDLRKLTMVLLALAFAGLMTACGGSSSTDEALTTPGDNYLGTLRFDVDPTNQKVEISQVTAPWSSTKIPGDGTGHSTDWEVSSSNVSWNGSNTIAFDVTLKWKKTTHDLTNVRIGVNASTDMDVRLVGGDRCGNTPWSSCLPATDPAMNFVSDSTAENPETIILCWPPAVWPDADCKQSYYNTIGAGCGSMTTHWSLYEASGAPYTFWADLWGDQHPLNPLQDPRYDNNVPTEYLEVYKMDPTDSTYPVPTTASNTMKAGEWFYVRMWLDNAGNNRALPYTSDLTEGPKRIEDTGNIAAWAYGGDPSAWYWYTSAPAIGFRWDPAILEVNASIASDPPGNQAAKFNATTGTRLRVQTDAHGSVAPGADRRPLENYPYLSSNAMGMFKFGADIFAAGVGFYPNPCGLFEVNPNACNPGFDEGGRANADWNIGWIAVRVKVGIPSGAGTMIVPLTDTNDYVEAARTDGMPYQPTAHQRAPTDYSANYPVSYYIMPRAAQVPGRYNHQRTYVCVQ